MKTRQSHHRHHHDDEDDRILQDGQTLRVPVTMMDSQQHAVVRHFNRVYDAGPVRITAADGSASGLHRPGFRVESGGGPGGQLLRDSDRAARETAYELYDEQITNAWQGNQPTGAGRGKFVGAQEGDSCTLDGRRGHLEMVGGQLQCVPDRAADTAAVTDERAAAHAEYTEYLRNAWRG
jgi:hypothetical protein